MLSQRSPSSVICSCVRSMYTTYTYMVGTLAQKGSSLSPVGVARNLPRERERERERKRERFSSSYSSFPNLRLLSRSFFASTDALYLCLLKKHQGEKRNRFSILPGEEPTLQEQCRNVEIGKRGGGEKSSIPNTT